MTKIFPILFICAAFLCLITLGTWQVQRLAWKNDIIEKLETEYQKDPLKAPYTKANLTALATIENPIRYGSIKGKFSTKPPIFLGPKIVDGKRGLNVIHPFILQDGGSIFVTRGWIAEEEKQTLNLPQGNSTQTISGIFRKPDWNNYTSNNKPEIGFWSKPDINEMADFYQLQDVMPVMLFATDIANNQNLLLQDTKWYPRNKHRQYAIFWYTMSIVLLILSALVFRTNRKKTL